MIPDKLILVGVDRNLCSAWEEAFAEFDKVEVVFSLFQKVETYDCMVSAANSFGLMDGGIDGAITHYFGDDLQKRVQAYIIENYLGEQPVGTSFIIETGHPKHPYLAHTPTMRIPKPINKTDGVYLAMRAMLLAVYHFNKIEKRIGTVLCPGLGTLTGKVWPKDAAHQMAQAYRTILSPPDWIDWNLAREREESLGLG